MAEAEDGRRQRLAFFYWLLLLAAFYDYRINAPNKEERRRPRRHTQHPTSFYEDSDAVTALYNFCDRRLADDVARN